MHPKHLSRQKIVAGNWKMNGDREFSATYLSRFQENLQNLQFESSEQLAILLIPPALFLSGLQAQLKEADSNFVQLAAQNASAYDKGAFTGEISAAMLQEFCSWCLVGHSERRALFAESDQVVVDKVSRLLDVKMRPILCLGETLEEREQGRAESCVREQLQAVLSRFDESQLSGLVLAYEPVWAIGTGKTASPEQAQSMHCFIREVLAEKSQVLAETTPILYGGSVNAGNAGELFAQVDIDGALVGGASLKADEFASICVQCASSI